MQTITMKTKNTTNMQSTTATIKTMLDANAVATAAMRFQILNLLGAGEATESATAQAEKQSDTSEATETCSGVSTVDLYIPHIPARHYLNVLGSVYDEVTTRATDTGWTFEIEGALFRPSDKSDSQLADLFDGELLPGRIIRIEGPRGRGFPVESISKSETTIYTAQIAVDSTPGTRTTHTAEAPEVYTHYLTCFNSVIYFGVPRNYELGLNLSWEHSHFSITEWVKFRDACMEAMQVTAYIQVGGKRFTVVLGSSEVGLSKKYHIDLGTADLTPLLNMLHLDADTQGALGVLSQAVHVKACADLLRLIGPPGVAKCLQGTTLSLLGSRDPGLGWVEGSAPVRWCLYLDDLSDLERIEVYAAAGRNVGIHPSGAVTATDIQLQTSTTWTNISDLVRYLGVTVLARLYKNTYKGVRVCRESGNTNIYGSGEMPKHAVKLTSDDLKI